MEAFAQELAQTSIMHISILRDILGQSASPAPAINLNAFAQVFNSALNTQLQPAFDAFGARARPGSTRASPCIAARRGCAPRCPRADSRAAAQATTCCSRTRRGCWRRCP
jgi:hypothetical protein